MEKSWKGKLEGRGKNRVYTFEEKEKERECVWMEFERRIK
jgi:hypothetical protein